MNNLNRLVTELDYTALNNTTGDLVGLIRKFKQELGSAESNNLDGVLSDEIAYLEGVIVTLRATLELSDSLLNAAADDEIWTDPTRPANLTLILNSLESSNG